MNDISNFNSMELRDLFYTKLIGEGITAPAESVAPLFKAGVAYDTESTTITHSELDRVKKNGEKVYKTVIDNCFCYAYQFAICDCYAIYRRKEQIVNALKILIEVVKDIRETREGYEGAVCCVWGANLAHEWAFIKNELTQFFNITKLFAKTARDVLLVQFDECVELREALGLFGHSLDDISKHWCNEYKKLSGEYDYNKIRTSETELDAETELPYMRNDVLSLTEMHKNAVEYYTQENGCCKLPYTSSGFVRMKLKNAIRDDDELTEEREAFNFDRDKPIKTNIEYLKYKNRRAIVNEYQWNICRDYSYAGGLCGSNIDYVGKILHDVVCADVTSDYPAQMCQKLFPAGRLRRVSYKRYESVKNAGKPFFALLHIHTMKSYTHHATFSKHKILNEDSTSPLTPQFDTCRNMVIYNGKVKRGDNMLVIWNDVDIKAYKEIYDIKATCIDLWVFDGYARAPKWLTDSMCDDYINKANLKAQGLSNTQDYAESKRNVNTYYGVLSTRVNDVNDALDKDLNFINSKEKSFYQLARDFWLNPYIAFWVTSYARALLMHFIARYPDAIVQYDTDSLYYIKSKGHELERALLEYNAEILKINKRRFADFENPEIFYTLGQWDFDDVYKRFLPLGAKKYIKEDNSGIHTVIAGLPKSAIPKEIQERSINEPLTYYNPVVRYVEGMSPAIIIEHMFAKKFASVYYDTSNTEYFEIVDHKGHKAMQAQSSYHAITPIDFTLKMGADFLKYTLHIK